MRHRLPALDVDLLVEHDGHRLKLRGFGMNFIAKFPTLLSLIHFARIGWSFRKRIPEGCSVRIEWRQVNIRLKPLRGKLLP